MALTAHTAKTSESFDWPCDRRDAHHPHPIEIECVDFFDCDAPYHKDSDTGVVHVHDCLGVAAHPATMAGGQYANERPEVQA